jgi:branched-chain amino acid transport system ATP-binding protein
VSAGTIQAGAATLAPAPAGDRSAAALLEVRGLAAQYGPTKVLHGIDFAVAAAGITTVLGANGAGKTTLLRAVCNMIRRAARFASPASASTASRPRRSSPRRRPRSRRPRHVHEPLVEENLRLGAHTRKDRAEIGPTASACTRTSRA